MKRRYTTGVIIEAFANSPRIVTKPVLTKDYQAGRFTAQHYLCGRQKIYGATVYDIQSWLVVTNQATVPEWVLRRLLDLCAEKIVAKGGARANLQKHLDKETGNDHSN